MARHLVLRLEAPLISFGGEAIDNFGVVRDFPAASMLTGLIANALGYRRGDWESHEKLQRRIVFGARLDRMAERMQDFQTAEIGKRDQGWTMRGTPEGRGGASYTGPHLRFRDYDADVCICVALRLESAEEDPTLDDIAEALDRPARPLFIGRKPCLPSAHIVEGLIEADTTLGALREFPRLTSDPDERDVALFWPFGEGDLDRSECLTVTDQRNWRSGVHGGGRRINRAIIPLPPLREVRT